MGSNLYRPGDEVRWIDSRGYWVRGTVIECHDHAASVNVTWQDQGQSHRGRDIQPGVQVVSYGRLEIHHGTREER